MKNNKNITRLIIMGGIILVIFVIILTVNLIPNYESNSYFVKVDNEINAKIESVNIKDNTLTIKTSGQAVEYCVKSTRTKPNKDSLCFNKIENNSAKISVYNNKKYYVWIKDNESNISNFVIVNSDQ